MIKMMKLNDVYEKAKDNWVSRVIADEVIIMPLCRSEDDMQYIYSISNETGARIFALLDGRHSVRGIQEVIKREFKGNAEVIEREVAEFLKDLLSVKLIETSGRRKSTRIEDPESRNDTRSSMLDARSTGKKKPYKAPVIAKVKMQPEQAVLSCCVNNLYPKYNTDWGRNLCMLTACSTVTCLATGSAESQSGFAGTS
jgi:hypothetical protein